GVVESINTTIKAVLRRARGMRDEEMLLLKLKWATAHPIRSARDLMRFLSAQPLYSNRRRALISLLDCFGGLTSTRQCRSTKDVRRLLEYIFCVEPSYDVLSAAGVESRDRFWSDLAF